MEEKQFKIALAVLLTIFAIAITLIMVKVVEADVHRLEVKEACISNGYPKVIEINSTTFCHRLNNGTDEIIPIEWVLE